ncbi:UvrD-helicase domain-containing protein [Aquipuribacter sp. MA13-6]|uniref:UvrD-helicase domain-containing protein n=1 Tax=unclassified Aquipuribacter TaxID=2635084 RepID=UPI003EE8BF15
MTALLDDVEQLERALGLQYHLADEQRAVVTAPLDSALVVAGAGSGKTETMSLRVAWLVGTGQVRADEVLGLTFTRKAAGELEERVTRAVERMQAWAGAGRGPAAEGSRPDPSVLVERPQARTYHSFAADLVATHSARLHLDEVRLLGEAACHQLVDTVVGDWPHPLDIGLNPNQVSDAVLSLAGQCAEHRVSTDELAASLDDHVDLLARQLDAGYLKTVKEREVLEVLGRRRALVPLLAEYTRRKRSAGLLDHGDQVLLAAEVAGHPEVAEQLRAEHRVVFLDEYQDTSAVQTDLLAALFGRGHPVTAVGDPHQSIFGWRGASSGTLGRFLRHFSTAAGGPPAQFTLSTSWRNPARVLDVANAVSAGLREPGPGGTGGLEVGVLHPAPGARPGRVRSAYLETVEHESDLVADWLAGRRESADAVPTQAVLCRRRSQMSRFEDALRHRGVPVVVLGLGGLLDEPEVVDLVSVLTAAAYPGRGDAVVRLLTGPRWQLAPADLDALSDRARELAGDDRDAASLVDALDLLPGPEWTSPRGRRLSDAGRARCSAVAAVLARVRQSLHRPVVDIVLSAVSSTAVDVEVLASAGDPRQGRRVLDRFVSEAAGYVDVDGTSTLGGFLTWLDAAREDERGLEVVDVAPDPAAVQIITIHSAKGLEWDDVAVVDLVVGGFPVREASGRPAAGWLSGNGELPWPARGDVDSLPAWRPAGAVSREDWKQRHEQFRSEAGLHAAAEERRLAYVALTRPRRSLLATGARWATGSTPREPSPFLVDARDAGAVPVSWFEPSGDDSDLVNPREVPELEQPWPAPGGHEQVLAAADAVVAARSSSATPGAAGSPDTSDEPSGPLSDPVLARWEALVDALLAERDAGLDTPVPTHLSASQVVALADDPEVALADLVRPVPRRPFRQARRGSRFHEWVESRSGPRRGLFEPEELVGAADDAEADDTELQELKARFEASEWATADVVGVEVPFATPIDTPAGRIVLRGRVDAVVRSTDPRHDLDVVDWKTGRPPVGRAAEARSAQLAVYRLAVARLHDRPLERVGAAFWYGSGGPAGTTLRPLALLDEVGLARLLGATARPVSAAQVHAGSTSAGPVTGRTRD